MSDLLKRKPSKLFMTHQNSASSPKSFAAVRTKRPLSFKPLLRNKVLVLRIPKVMFSDLWQGRNETLTALQNN